MRGNKIFEEQMTLNGKGALGIGASGEDRLKWHEDWLTGHKEGQGPDGANGEMAIVPQRLISFRQERKTKREVHNN